MMDSDRPPHRTGTTPSSSTNNSELFICFTSRLSSSPSMKSILSPNRSRDQLPISLSKSTSRRLRASGSIRGGLASPMFPPGHKKRGSAGFENPEPSSPKVTCIGQVRVKTKKQGKKMRTLSRRRRGSSSEVSFRKVEQQLSREGSSRNFQQQSECRNQRWVHLPLTICEALKGFGSEFSCLFPCRSSCFSTGEREKGEKSGESYCGSVFARWLVALSDGKGEREIELVVGGEEERRGSFSRHGVCGREFEDEKWKVKDGEEEGRVSICVPPKNALLLMRCRSDPLKLSALANRMRESPVTVEEEEEEEIAGGVKEGNKNIDDGVAEDTQIEYEDVEEDLPIDNDGVEKDKQIDDDDVVVVEEDRQIDCMDVEEDIQIEYEDVEEGKLILDDDDVDEEKQIDYEDVEEEQQIDYYDIEEDKQTVDDDFEEGKQINVDDFEGRLNVEVVNEVKDESRLEDQGCEEEEYTIPVWAFDEEEGNEETEMNISVEEVAQEAEKQEENDNPEEQLELCKEEQLETKVQAVNKKAAEEEESSTAFDGYSLGALFSEEESEESTPEEEKLEIDSPSEVQHSDIEESEKSEKRVLNPTAASALKLEEKEISTTELEDSTQEEEKVTEHQSSSSKSEQNLGEGNQRVLLERESAIKREKPVLPDCLLMMMCEPKLSMEVSKETWVCSTDFIERLPEKKTTTDGPDDAKEKKRESTESNPPRSSWSFQTPVVSMTTMIEERLVNSAAYEPFVLTRCKSAPVRTAAKLAPEAGCWKDGKLELHRRPAFAAGVGF